MVPSREYMEVELQRLLERRYHDDRRMNPQVDGDGNLVYSHDVAREIVRLIKEWTDAT